MIEVIQVQMKPEMNRIGIVLVKYYDLVLYCDFCLYKGVNLWVRMPELWLERDLKQHFVMWPEKKDSDEFQKIVLQQIIQKTGMTVEKAREMRQDVWRKNKKKRIDKKI